MRLCHLNLEITDAEEKVKQKYSGNPSLGLGPSVSFPEIPVLSCRTQMNLKILNLNMALHFVRKINCQLRKIDLTL
jgi:hypothetical protein